MSGNEILSGTKQEAVRKIRPHHLAEIEGSKCTYLNPCCMMQSNAAGRYKKLLRSCLPFDTPCVCGPPPKKIRSFIFLITLDCRLLQSSSYFVLLSVIAAPLQQQQRQQRQHQLQIWFPLLTLLLLATQFSWKIYV